jgi:single-strand DNA-binding protein
MINKVLLIGNLGADPEVRHTQAGMAVATFNLATSEKRKGRGGQMQDQTEWHRVVAWDKLAELCKEYLHKGMKVYVEGRLQTRKWQDKNGHDRWNTEIIAREMKILTPKGGETSGYNSNPGPASGLPPSGYESYSGGTTGSDVPF